ncbi:hypothetical protein K1719_018388 [Acacia pycnantha]|nr:hypothetical protein K1719_018388 [Acacia pycnantha]
MHKQAVGLLEIKKLLLRNGKSFNDYPSLPKPNEENLIDMSNQLILQELNYNKEKENDEAIRLQNLMTDEQKEVFHKILSSVSSRKGGFFFLHGFGGTGKTFIWNALIASKRSNDGNMGLRGLGLQFAIYFSLCKTALSCITQRLYFSSSLTVNLPYNEIGVHIDASVLCEVLQQVIHILGTLEILHNLLIGRDVLKLDLTWRIGDGSKVRASSSFLLFRCLAILDEFSVTIGIFNGLW